MERIAFLLDPGPARIGCLLNPETLLLRRTAGLRRRRSLAGVLGGARFADDPILYTGGGATELVLDLLFDVSLAGSSIETDDVRDLTRPLWQLAEPAPGDPGAQGRPALVRLVWGKSWNLPGVVAQVAERLEDFTTGGAPRRSWLRMRFWRVSEAPAPPAALAVAPAAGLPPLDLGGIPPEDFTVHQVLGDGTAAAGPGGSGEPPPGGERAEELAARYLGDSALWRVIAVANDLVDPLRIEAGRELRIPPREAVEERR